MSRIIGINTRSWIKALSNAIFPPEEVDRYMVVDKYFDISKKLAMRGNNDLSTWYCKINQFRVFGGLYDFRCERLELQTLNCIQLSGRFDEIKLP